MSKRKKLRLIKKGSKSSISNQRVVKATVIGVNKDLNGVLDGDLDDLERSPSTHHQKLIQPPFDPLVLTQLPENSSELGKCIEAMEINIDGFGGRIKSILPRQLEKEFIGAGEDADTTEQKANRTEYYNEWYKLDSLFNNPNFDDNLTTLRRKTRKDLESTGNGYWEILRDSDGDITSILHVPSYSMRIGKQCSRPIEVEINQLQPDFTYVKKKFRKRFRLFAKVVSYNKYVWFKEWGDPRNIDSLTGNEVTPDKLDAFPKDRLATEVMWFKIYSSRSVYGLPRYIGNLFEIYGSRAASEINFITFKNNNIPSMAVLVSGGMMTDSSISRIEEFVNSQITKSGNRSSFLLLEADISDDGLQSGTGQVKMDIKTLTNNQHNDELFQDYDKNNREKIRETFRLPPVYVGRGNPNEALSSKKLAEEQVFSPERDEMDRKINLITMDMGIRYWRFKSYSASVTDDNSLTKILSGAEKTGGMTPNLSREIIGDVLNTDLPPYEATDQFNPDLPMSFNLMKLSSQAGGQPGGNLEDGLLGPNQGQVPRGPDLNEDNNEDEIPTLTKSTQQISKPERRPGESFEQCVERGIAELIDEGKSPEQAVAQARAMCDLRKRNNKGIVDTLKSLEDALHNRIEELHGEVDCSCCKEE